MTGSTKLVVLAIVLIFGLALFVLGVDMIASPSQYDWMIPRGLCPILGQGLMVLAFMMTFGIIAYMLGIAHPSTEEEIGTLDIPAAEAISAPPPAPPASIRPPPTPEKARTIPPTASQPIVPVTEDLPHLIGLTGGLPGSVEIHRGVFTIGRGTECDLVLSSQLVSRRHAQLEWNGEVLLIHDLGSSNTTRVNDKILERETTLEDGDVIQIVDYHLEVELPASISRTVVIRREDKEPSDTVNLPPQDELEP
jgi:FHA domain-containing protein